VSDHLTEILGPLRYMSGLL